MDVISLPIEFDNKKIDGKFRLCAIASQRAKELALGARPKIATKSKKVTTIAIEEAIADKLEFLTGEQARIEKEKEKKLDFRRLLEEGKTVTSIEDMSELEKDLKIYLHEKDIGTDQKTFDELFRNNKEGESEEN